MIVGFTGTREGMSFAQSESLLRVLRGLLFSIDPGLRKSGVALWRDGELVAAKLIEPRTDDTDIALAVEAMADAVQGWKRNSTGGGSFHLVCERPRTYGGRAGKGDANDLIAVALVVGALLGRLGCPTSLPLPEEWKGGIPKPKTKGEYIRDGYPIEERAKFKLSSAELARVEWPRDWRKKMDVSDALGIGLWSLGR